MLLKNVLLLYFAGHPENCKEVRLAGWACWFSHAFLGVLPLEEVACIA